MVLPLETLRAEHAPLIGAKALNLALMIQEGLPVPRGFCITGTAYRDFLQEHRLYAVVAEALEVLAKASPESVRAVLAELRRHVMESPLSAELTAQVERQYLGLKAKRVVVRSSATAEDLPTLSFAGQYDTFLGIGDFPECLNAVKGCWASLWTERAYAYREKNLIPHDTIVMAVIVQELIEAEAAGVIFTADPVTGSRDLAIIEGCYGLGESLVSGRVSPDRIVLSKKSFRVLEHRVSEKTVETVPAEGGGVREQAVPASRARRTCLRDGVARRLGKLSIGVERTFGHPLDLEWALAAGKLYFLQSRPITAITGPKSWQERQIWSNLNSGEVLPHVATPVTWSMLDLTIKPLFSSMFNSIGIDFGHHPLIGSIGGRVYFNLNTFYGAFKRLPLLGKMDLGETLGGRQQHLWDGKFHVPDVDIPDLKFSYLKLLLKLPTLLLWSWTHSPERGIRFISDWMEKHGGEHRSDLSALSENELFSYLQSLLDEIHRYMAVFGYLGAGFSHFAAFRHICRKWLQDQEDSITYRLLAGLGDMDSAEAGLDIWRLTRVVRKHRGVRDLVLSGQTFEVVRDKLPDLGGGKEFLKEWGAFMTRHGHHARGELELANARWLETPGYIFDLVRGYLAASDKRDPVANHRQRALEREELEKHCLKKLRNPIGRGIFKFLLEKARKSSILRENLKSVAVRHVARIRWTLLELGQRLVKQGRIGEKEDIFFLRLEEIGPALLGAGSSGVKSTIEERKGLYEKNKTITPPSVVVGVFDPEHFTPDEVEENAETLAGIAVSPGVATGPARVILLASEHEQVLPGEILVAPFTDPGWTPYFLQASAIVMDMGGILSHGSILAREYGIPAVVNVGPATKIIRTGQILRVDGDKGIVRIVK
ncbi:MAG: hypothetical protein HYU64_19520 [Armatimonadetes bacterium]|nr:hypothetical protein [Armatimonadota bacterium]